MKRYEVTMIIRTVDSRNEFDKIDRLTITSGTLESVRNRIIDYIEKWFTDVTMSDGEWGEFIQTGSFDLGTTDISDPEWDEEEFGPQWAREEVWLEIDELGE